MDAAKPSLISRNPLYFAYYSYYIQYSTHLHHAFPAVIPPRGPLPSPRWHPVLRFLERSWYYSYDVDCSLPPMQHIVLEAETDVLRSQLLLPARAEISYELARITLLSIL